VRGESSARNANLGKVSILPKNHVMSELQRRHGYLLRRHWTDGDGAWGTALSYLSAGCLEATFSIFARVARGGRGQKRQNEKSDKKPSTPNLCSSYPTTQTKRDQIRESIMIWPVQDQQWRNSINTLLHCLPIQTANTPQLPRKWSQNFNSCFTLVPHCAESRRRRRRSFAANCGAAARK